MTRWSASALHLGISLLVGLSFVALTRWIWYPGPLFDVSGAVGLLTILIPADIVLGPLLTLLVFKPGKPSLKFDLTVIAAVQLAALLYGAWTIAEVRPAYVVFYGNQLKVMRSTDLAEGAPWQTPLLGPQWVAIPSGGAMESEIADLTAKLAGREPAVFDRTRYQPWSQHQLAFTAAMQSLSMIQPETAANEIATTLQQRNLDPASVRLLAITVRDQRMTAVFLPESDELQAIIPVAMLAR